MNSNASFAMRPPQSDAIARALEILGEQFDTVVILAQPEPRHPHVEVHHTGSWHSVASICAYAQTCFEFPETVPIGEHEDDEEPPALPSQ